MTLRNSRLKCLATSRHTRSTVCVETCNVSLSGPCHTATAAWGSSAVWIWSAVRHVPETSSSSGFVAASAMIRFALPGLHDSSAPPRARRVLPSNRAGGIGPSEVFGAFFGFPS